MAEIQEVTLDINEIPQDIASQEEIARLLLKLRLSWKSSLHRELRHVLKVAQKER